MTSEATYPTAAPGARFLSSYHWTTDGAGFGGYSAICLNADGAGFVMLSDRSHTIEGTIFRSADRIIGVRSAEMKVLDFPDDLFDTTPVRDTEGLARDSQGRLYVSLESINRVIRRDISGLWTALPRYPVMDGLPINRGLEALAIGPDDAVYAIPESSEGLRAPFPVFRFREEFGWDQPMSISRSGGVLPVGADIGPDGLLYVLERGFSGFGFFSRVRRFDPGTSGEAIGETLLVTKPRQHDNLEGISIWRAQDGTLRITMVSDDNFLFLQKTEIVEYAIGK